MDRRSRDVVEFVHRVSECLLDANLVTPHLRMVGPGPPWTQRMQSSTSAAKGIIFRVSCERKSRERKTHDEVDPDEGVVHETAFRELSDEAKFLEDFGVLVAAAQKEDFLGEGRLEGERQQQALDAAETEARVVACSFSSFKNQTEEEELLGGWEAGEGEKRDQRIALAEDVTEDVEGRLSPFSFFSPLSPEDRASSARRRRSRGRS